MFLPGNKEQALHRLPAKYARKQMARSILIRHFKFPQTEADTYISLAARREGMKVSDIEKEVIKLGRGLL